jgi:hypothetical protein
MRPDVGEEASNEATLEYVRGSLYGPRIRATARGGITRAVNRHRVRVGETYFAVLLVSIVINIIYFEFLR